MGSSKKHKEKDKDRESRHKRRRRSRSRSKERRERRRREKDEYRDDIDPPRDYGQRSKDGRSREMDYAEELQNYAFVQIKQEDDNDTPPSVTSN